MSFLFFNGAGRVRSGWRFLIFSLVFLFLSLAASGFLFSLAAQVPALQTFLAGNGGFLAQNFVTLTLAAGLGLTVQKIIEDLPPRALGWIFQIESLKNFGFGFAAGVLTLLIAIGIALAAGAVNFRVNDSANSAHVLQSFLISLTIFALGAAAEETLFRGYILQTFARARLAWLAIIVTSLPFALVHLNNPNVAPIFTFLNTALAGVWLAVAYLKTRSLWFPFGVHFAWNWMMNQFFGIPVSGITKIAPAPFLQYSDSNSFIRLTGGDYGIEGGAACTVALVLSTLFIWFAPFPKPDAELLLLTSRENPVKAGNQIIV